MGYSDLLGRLWNRDISIRDKTAKYAKGQACPIHPRTDNGVSVADPGREGAAISNKEGLLDAALMGRLALSTGVVNGDRAGPLRGPRPPGE